MRPGREATMFRKAFAFVAVAALVALAQAPGPATASGTIGFTVGLKFLPLSDGGNEPSLAIGNDGTRFVSWQAPGEAAVSSDGIRWQNRGVIDNTTAGDVTNAIDASGAFFNGQICEDAFALHTCIYRSRDQALHWPQKSEPADSHPGASDRPWIDVYPKHSATPWNPDNTRVYLEYHTFSPDDLAYVTVSTDGGKTFSAPKDITNDPDALNSSSCNTI